MKVLDFDPFGSLSDRLNSVDQFIFNPLDSSNMISEFEKCLKSSGADAQKIKEFGIDLVKAFGDEEFIPENFENLLLIKCKIAEEIMPKIELEVMEGLLICSFYTQLLQEKFIEKDVENTAVLTILYYVSLINGSIPNRLSKKGNDNRHAENRSMKNDVFNWADKNMHKFASLDAAAEAIAGKLVNAKFRTIRVWLTEWRKEQKAGRRPSNC